MTLLTVFAPAGVELRAPALRLARQRLSGLGYEVTLDPSVRARHQRFAGDDEKAVTRFQSQAEILQTLSHLNIVRYRFVA